MKKKMIVFLLLAIILSGCTNSSSKSSSTHFQIVDVSSPGSNTNVALIFYETEKGDIYYRVLPNMDIIESSKTGYYNDYPIEWTSIPAPGIQE